ncbi:hypothetical protein KUTeg_022229 [Tegillarca granosa]|uniref:Ion transport domain-containing protein n=1 Tax=Tegillarca granosa TaxID=220873 RepID=A0ABQ9E6F4_TEGGR|nr:hypothetical protein KUTeg_022229 [Tegillarca granosa]
MFTCAKNISSTSLYLKARGCKQLIDKGMNVCISTKRRQRLGNTQAWNGKIRFKGRMDARTEKRLRNHYLGVLDRDSQKFMRDFSECIKTNNEDKISVMYKTLGGYTNSKNTILFYRENEDETILHIAAKYQDDEALVFKLVDLEPRLMLLARDQSMSYRGQTALHIAITKGNYEAVEAMLAKAACVPSIKTDIICKPATGVRFVNTVMMGELPLSVAALKFNTEMVDLLLYHGAEINRRNTHGDTVFHSLIKYAAIYPDKIYDVIKMFDHLHKCLLDTSPSLKHFDDADTMYYSYESTYVWFLRNNDGLAPFQLAASHGIPELFEYILNLKDVYYFVSTHDGLFDVKLYDITDIDTVSNLKATIAIKSSSLQHQHRVVPSRVEGISKKGLTSNMRCLPCTSGECRYPQTPSILEMMYDCRLDVKSVFRIINLTPVKDIIKAKWSAYSLVFFIWMFLHFLFLITLTAYSVVRADMYEAMESNTSFSPVQTTFVNAYHWLGVVIGVIYVTISILLIVAKFRKPLPLIYNIWHNLQYITLLLVFSVLLIYDSLIHGISGKSDSILLILALIAGWWFSVFFLSAFQHFSFFTEMIRRVIIGDLLRFFVIIAFELVSFTASMYIMFAGRKIPSENNAGILVPDDNFDGYFATMLTMFKLMLGLGDIEILYEAKIPGLAIALFIAFIILTYVLMINALIAMMSQTCALVLEDRYPQWRVQQLSVVLFLEDIIFVWCLSKFINSPGEEKTMKGYDPETKQNKSQLRYFLEIHSLQMEYATDEDRDAINKKRGRESPFRTLHIPPGGSDYFDLTMSRDLTERQGQGLMNSRRLMRPLSPRKQIYDSLQVPDIRIPSVSENLEIRPSQGSPDVSTSIKRRKSNKSEKKRQHLDSVEEEPSTNAVSDPTYSDNLRHVIPKDPDISALDKGIQVRRNSSTRKRHKSENLHEKETKNRGVQHSPPSEPVTMNIGNPVFNTDIPNGNVLHVPIGNQQLDIETVTNYSNTELN